MREGVGLVGFLETDTAQAVLSSNYYSLCVPSLLSIQEAIRPYRSAVLELSVQDCDRALVKELPPHLDVSAAAVSLSADFQEFYAPASGLEFGVVEIESLLAPQFFADLSYVEEIRLGLGESPDPSSVFNLLFGRGTLAPPVLAQTTATFASARRDLYTSGLVRAQQVDDRAFDISLRVCMRPNFCHVTRLDNVGLVLTNGVHRVLALYQLGVREIPCLWDSIAHESGLGFDNPTTQLIFHQLSHGHTRPALVTDYLNNQIAAPVSLKSMGLVLRMTVNSELFTIPAILEEFNVGTG